MKARMTYKPAERVLTFAVGETAQPLLTAVLQQLSIEERRVSPEEINQDVGYLAGFPGFVKKETDRPLPPLGREAEGGVLCMCGLTGVRMNALLKALRENGAPISLKATVTPTNQHWAFRRLVEELRKEHDALAGRTKA